MNRCASVVLAAFLALAGSWAGLVLAPWAQLGRQVESKTVPEGEAYPPARPGLAVQGREVYRANGCASCHSQQVRQQGVRIGVAVVHAGTNVPGLVEAILRASPRLSRDEATRLVRQLPQAILSDVPASEARRVRRGLEALGAEAVVTISPFGPDIERGWGKRRSVAADYLLDHPVMLGSQRIGPDLANVGGRAVSREWLLTHLYAPRSVVPGSLMPPYRYLFEKRRVRLAPSPEALRLPEVAQPGPGWEVVPKDEARALVAYLLSLNSSVSLYEAPLSPPPDSRVGQVAPVPTGGGPARPGIPPAP